jgi:nucleoside-diphosphate-sugar epimerase
MNMNENAQYIINPQDRILVTGAAGFVGKRVVEALLSKGFRNVRCLVRSERGLRQLHAAIEPYREEAHIEILHGNLVSPRDCTAATENVAVIYHLAAGAGQKSVPDAYLNSVVATRNLLEAAIQQKCMKRLVNVSSLAVYDVASKRGKVLDETCPVDVHPEVNADAYEFAKVKQDEIVVEYMENRSIPIVIVRPGYVLGPGKRAISGRVGIGTFGRFLHLGGPNFIPFTYVENCADAIVLAGLKQGIEGEVFNIIDDDLPSSRMFLHEYKNRVKQFNSLYLPHVVSYVLCWMWERYSIVSDRQLPPVFNRTRWYKYWKRTRYTNEKVKGTLGWMPKVTMRESLSRYFESCLTGEHDA